MLNKIQSKRDKLFRHRGAGVFWAICVGLLVLSLWLSERYVSRVSAWRIRCWTWFQQVQVIAGTPVYYLEGWVKSWSNRHEWYVRYKRLLEEQRYLTAQAAQIEALRRENLAMARLLRLIGDDEMAHGHGWLAASLINTPQSQFNYRFMIDKGLGDNVRSGQMVINEQGVVGRTDVIVQHASVVIPIISSDSVIPVKIERTGRNCFCAGDGSNGLTLLSIPNSTDIQIDDRIITSDLGGGWLPNYLVGIVQKIEKTNDRAFLAVRVKPAIDCWCLRNVMLLQTHE